LNMSTENSIEAGDDRSLLSEFDNLKVDMDLSMTGNDAVIAETKAYADNDSMSGDESEAGLASGDGGGSDGEEEEEEEEESDEASSVSSSSSSSSESSSGSDSSVDSNVGKGMEEQKAADMRLQQMVRTWSVAVA
jgi:hypothetical protein